MEKDCETKLKRYHHPSHKHKLFLNINRRNTIFCDNINCKKRIGNNEVSYVCFQCDFDLCVHCFNLPTDKNSVCELDDSDKFINEDIYFQCERYQERAKTVLIQDNATRNVVNANENNYDDDENDIPCVDENDENDENDEEYDEDYDENDNSEITTDEKTDQKADQKTESKAAESKTESKQILFTVQNNEYDEETNRLINNFIQNSPPSIIFQSRVAQQQQQQQQQPSLLITQRNRNRQQH